MAPPADDDHACGWQAYAKAMAAKAAAMEAKLEAMAAELKELKRQKYGKKSERLRAC